MAAQELGYILWRPCALPRDPGGFELASPALQIVLMVTHPAIQVKLRPITLYGLLLVNPLNLKKRVPLQADTFSLRQESCRLVSMTALQANQTNWLACDWPEPLEIPLTLAIFDT